MGDYIWITTLEDRAEQAKKAATERAISAHLREMYAELEIVKNEATERLKQAEQAVQAANDRADAMQAKLHEIYVASDTLKLRVETMRENAKRLNRAIDNALRACYSGGAHTLAAQIADSITEALCLLPEYQKRANADLCALARTPEAVNLDGDGEWPAAMSIHDTKDYVPAGTKNGKAPKGFAKSR